MAAITTGATTATIVIIVIIVTIATTAVTALCNRRNNNGGRLSKLFEAHHHVSFLSGSLPINIIVFLTEVQHIGNIHSENHISISLGYSKSHLLYALPSVFVYPIPLFSISCYTELS